MGITLFVIRFEGRKGIIPVQAQSYGGGGMARKPGQLIDRFFVPGAFKPWVG
jgi:hypothetical protein